MRVRGPLALLLIGLCAAVVGCGDQDTAQDPTPTGGPLDGTTYVVTEVSEDGRQRDLVAGSEVRLTFGGGRLGIQGGCNTMSGGYAVADDTLTVEPLASTEMACEEPLMAQDTWLSGLFSEPVGVARTDQGLTLTAGTTVLELIDREIAAPDAALTGTSWQLSGLSEGTGPDASVSSIPAGIEASLRIDGDGAVFVDTGCNTGRASIQIGPDTMKFTPLALTRRACPDVRAVENAIVAVLDGEVGYEIREQRLTLHGRDQGLQWQAVD